MNMTRERRHIFDQRNAAVFLNLTDPNYPTWQQREQGSSHHVYMDTQPISEAESGPHTTPKEASLLHTLITTFTISVR
jgi:hypothetical protein